MTKKKPTYSGGRSDSNHTEWARKVKVRSGHACQMCGVRDVYLESHHLNSYDIHIDERYDINNGITLCKHHHDSFHSAYGNGNNTKFQFAEYQQIYRLMQKIAIKRRVEPFIFHVNIDEEDIDYINE